MAVASPLPAIGMTAFIARRKMQKLAAWSSSRSSAHTAPLWGRIWASAFKHRNVTTEGHKWPRSVYAWVKLLAGNLTCNVARGMDFGRHLERLVVARCSP